MDEKENSVPAGYNLTQVHQASLKILKEIDRICRKYGIKYVLDSGTLIGAVRHGGFIPWDDDADVAFTRENYEKFIKVVRKELPKGMKLLEPYELRGGKAFYDFTPRILYLNSKTHDDDELMTYYDGRLNHLWVDLFIMDEQPENKAAAGWTKFLHTVIYGLAMGHRYKIEYSKYGLIGKLGVGILANTGRLIPMKTLFRWQRYVALKDRKGRSSLLYYSNYQPDYLYVTVRKEWSEETVDMPFEDTLFMTPKGSHQVLTEVYGDYMQMPPEEKRVPTHSDIEIQVTG